MRIYTTFGQLLDELLERAKKDDNPWISAGLYVREQQWEKAPIQAEVLLLNDEDDEEGFNEEDPDGPPLQALERGMNSFFDYATLEDIVAVQHRQKPHSTLLEYVAAINHYAEFDCFQTAN